MKKIAEMIEGFGIGYFGMALIVNAPKLRFYGIVFISLIIISFIIRLINDWQNLPK